MDNFNFLLTMERNRYNAKQKTQEEEEQIEREKQQGIADAVKLPRVTLPALNELDSYFTVLDNVNLPIQYVQD